VPTLTPHRREPPDAAWAWEQLSGEEIAWLGRLPEQVVLGDALFPDAAGAVRRSGWPVAEEFAAENVLQVPTREEAIAAFGG
jgi:hypothetical protein